MDGERLPNVEQLPVAEELVADFDDSLGAEGVDAVLDDRVAGAQGGDPQVAQEDRLVRVLGSLKLKQSFDSAPEGENDLVE